MPTQEPKLTLAAKLARIGREIGSVDKSGRNTQQNYNYIEYGVVAGRIRELFDQYGVIIIPSVESVETDEITNKYGSTGYHYVLGMKFTIINGDDAADRIEATWRGESADYGDKGINKAETSGTKYFLMRLFNVSEKGEQEAEATTPEIGSVENRKKATMAKVAMAKEKLAACATLEELRACYNSLGALKTNAEIMRQTNTLKAKFEQEAALAVDDTEKAIEVAKNAIDEQFNN